MDLYRTRAWRDFRAEKLRLDSFHCKLCDRSSSDGAILQIHHKSYKLGSKPWEYEFDQCITLCKGCHAEMHGLIMPKSGWDHIAWDDLGELNGECDVCGTAIRYVFTLFHVAWPPIDVGTDCCDRLTATNLASIEKAKFFSSRDRRRRFINSQRWTAKNNIHSLFHTNQHIYVVPFEQFFKIRFMGYIGKKIYKSIEDAKGKVFDIIEDGQLKTFLEKRIESISTYN